MSPFQKCIWCLSFLNYFSVLSNFLGLLWFPPVPRMIRTLVQQSEILLSFILGTPCPLPCSASGGGQKPSRDHLSPPSPELWPFLQPCPKPVCLLFVHEQDVLAVQCQLFGNVPGCLLPDHLLPLPSGKGVVGQTKHVPHPARPRLCQTYLGSRAPAGTWEWQSADTKFLKRCWWAPCWTCNTSFWSNISSGLPRWNPGALEFSQGQF